MKLDQKLAEWRDAGVIDAETAARIAAHERGVAKRPYLLYAVTGLGAVSIAIGLLSIVASNWEAIPAALKLVLDFALLLGLAAGIHHTKGVASEGSGNRNWVFEVLVFVFYGAVLASIGLVAQVYHLGGKTEDALLFWSLITAPIVFFGTTRMLALVWLLAAESVTCAQVARFLDRSWLRREDIIALTTGFLISLALVALGGSTAFRARKPAFAEVSGALGRVQIIALATFLPLAWYESAHEGMSGLLGIVCLAGVIAASVALALRDETKAPARTWILALAVAAPVLSYAPLLLEHDKSGFAAALSFLLVWGLVGVAAYRLGAIRLLNLATAFLGLRLLIIYFEVFGSLLDTGIGLLSGGVLTVLVAWIWVKKSRQWSGAGKDDKGGERG